MTWEVAVLLGLLVAALALFAWERIAADVTALGLLVALVATGLLPLNRAFDGFASDAVIAILGLLILTSALHRTGFVDRVGKKILDHVGQRPTHLLVFGTITVTAVSAFISNTAAAAFFLPIMIGLARKTRTSPSKYLMPLAFGAVLASSVTLVATSTNLIVSDLLSQHGLERLGMFELTPIGLPIAVVGVLYVLVIGRHLVPERAPSETLFDAFGESNYHSELLVTEDSRLVGKPLDRARFLDKHEVDVLCVVRGEERYFAGSLVLQPGDVLLVEGPRDKVLRTAETLAVTLRTDLAARDEPVHHDDVGLVEVVLARRSDLVGKTVEAANFEGRFAIDVLAINRHEERIQRKVGDVTLHAGDVLLLRGHRDHLMLLANEPGLRPLGGEIETPPAAGKATIAFLAFVLAIVLATFEILSLPTAALLGAVIVFLTGTTTPQEAYREVDWRILIVIACMLGFGEAMQSTGAAAYLADLVVALAGEADPRWLLAGFFIASVLLTQPMSNQAAAVVILPVAIATAVQLDLNPRTFAVMVAVAASTSYMTPLEPACLMVYRPGGYRFRDFLLVGGILTVLILGMAIVVVPMIWPL